MKKYILMTTLLIHAGTASVATMDERIFANILVYPAHKGVTKQMINSKSSTRNADQLKNDISNYKSISKFDYTGNVIPGVNPVGTQFRD
jgi:hypothetical protein